MTDPILEAADKSLQTILEMVSLGLTDTRRLAKVLLAAVTPLIRAAALEEAAQTADLYTKKEMPWTSHDTAHIIAGRIRTLKEQP